MSADTTPSARNIDAFSNTPSVSGRGRLMLFLALGRVSCLRLVCVYILMQLLSGCAPGDIKPRAALLDTQKLNVQDALLTPLYAPWPAQDWWKVYGDQQLDALVRLAVAQNPGLRIAEARVRQAAGAAQASGGGMFPRVEAGGQMLHTRYTDQAYKADAIAGHEDWDANLLASASYKLDLWGKEKAAYAAGLDNLAAAAVEGQAARLVLQTAVVRAYISLARQYALLEVAQRTLIQRQGVLDITRKLLKAGMGTELAVSQAEMPIPVMRSHIAQINADIAVIKYQLAALTGQGPGAAKSISPPGLSFSATAALPPDLPAELAGRRPDVVARLWRVEAAAQGVKAAKADFYPNINLLAAFGYVSIGLEHFLTASARYCFV